MGAESAGDSTLSPHPPVVQVQSTRGKLPEGIRNIPTPAFSHRRSIQRMVVGGSCFSSECTASLHRVGRGDDTATYAYRDMYAGFKPPAP